MRYGSTRRYTERCAGGQRSTWQPGPEQGLSTSTSKNKARGKNATVLVRAILVVIYCRAFPITTRVKPDQLRNGYNNNKQAHYRRLRQKDPLEIYFCLRRQLLRQALGFGPWGLGQKQAEARVIRPESARLEQLLGNMYRKCQPISKFLFFCPASVRAAGTFLDRLPKGLMPEGSGCS